MTEPAFTSGGAQAIANRFWSFDKLIGQTLVKVIYVIGLVCIGLGVLAYLGMGLMMLMASPAVGLLMIILAVPVGLVSVIFWRFVCELYMLMFLMYGRMGEIRDKLP